MKRFLLILFLLSSFISLYAQQNHFVYLQTDNKQPFYIKLNNQLYSSSSSGYIVVPKLQNGTYDFTFGFPKNEWLQQVIPVKIDNADIGYMLKNFGEKGWGLFNIQTLDVTMASSANTNNTVTQTKTDAFSNTLADVVNTPSLKEETKQKPPVETKTVVKETPVIIVDKKISDIDMVSTVLDNSGRSAIYIDRSNNNNDTVRIFIPYPKAVNVKPQDNPAEPVIAPVSQPVVKTEPEKKMDQPKTGEKFLDIELPNPNKSIDSVKKPATTQISQPIKTVTPAESTSTIADAPKTAIPPAVKSAGFNSDCKAEADDNDFLKLRKKMAAENNDDDMVTVAKKTFRSMCFSTEQIKNLSVLFLKDDGRYKFFDAAYPFVYDT
ncbi:MAG: DUF4476 domain-containing protein, partial [Ferruginibacter sp.]